MQDIRLPDTMLSPSFFSGPGLTGDIPMPKVKANNLTINYEQQGSGEPLILIPYLAADHACYAFQVAEYAKHFTCISLDLRGTGESGTPAGDYTTEDLADDVGSFMRAMDIPRAHVAGLSLGAAAGMWLAAKHPEMVTSLSLHSGWPKTDPFVKAIVESWQIVAKALQSVPEMVIRALFPWCFTPELYVAKPDYIESLAAFVRSRPAQSVGSFLQQSNAVIAHDVEAQLQRITAPTLITFGRYDMATSTRFADRMKGPIRKAEVLIFEGCAHAPLYEKVEEFNAKTLSFLQRHTAAGLARSGAA
jgi:pimeloyl-ACP methyl ester carboxylesterase